MNPKLIPKTAKNNSDFRFVLSKDIELTEVWTVRIDKNTKISL